MSQKGQIEVRMTIAYAQNVTDYREKRRKRESAYILSTDVCVKRKPLRSLEMFGPLAFRCK
jgi:hypothetical protein